MSDIRIMIENNANQEVVAIPMILHGRLVKLLTECGARRGKTIRQVISEAILEKADKMYNEDLEKGKINGRL